MARPSKEQILPYKLHAIALYGRFKWVARDNLGAVRIPTARLASRLRIRAHQVKDALETLENWGLITKFNWYGHYFEMWPEIPQGMCIHVDMPEIRVSSDIEPEILQLEAEDE